MVVDEFLSHRDMGVFQSHESLMRFMWLLSLQLALLYGRADPIYHRQPLE